MEEVQRGSLPVNRGAGLGTRRDEGVQGRKEVEDPSTPTHLSSLPLLSLPSLSLPSLMHHVSHTMLTNTATLSPESANLTPTLSISVDLPAPGGPDSPTLMVGCTVPCWLLWERTWERIHCACLCFMGFLDSTEGMEREFGEGGGREEVEGGREKGQRETEMEEGKGRGREESEEGREGENYTLTHPV